MNIYTTYTRPLYVRAQYSRKCPIISSSCYNSSLVTWMVVCLTAAMFKPLVFPVSGFACLSLSLSHIATDGQSVCLPWYRAPSGDHDQILVTVWQFLFCPWGGRPLGREGVSVFCQSLSAVISQLSVASQSQSYVTTDGSVGQSVLE
jgi:hypothetical protein